MPKKTKEDWDRVAFERLVMNDEVLTGLRFLEKKGKVVAHLFIRAFGAVGATFLEVCFR